ncbi:hypothetical protein BGX27_006504 [Mortierella sp. AM989]|nr:hypothetical protein BGX27_006504 [Mortierella sp. AM989]
MTVISAALPRPTIQRSSSLSFSHISSASPSFNSLTHGLSSTRAFDCELERQRHLRQNQEIIRLCALRSTQIRQSETKLSQLENENLELRTTLRRVEQQIGTKSVAQPVELMTLSPHLNTSITSLKRLELNLGRGDVYNGKISPEQRLHKQDKEISPESNRENSENGRDCAQYESRHGNDNEENEALRVKRHRSHVASDSPLMSKQSLVLKLNQIQLIYQREHEALCAMMNNFNSTTRLYRDTICLLEQKSAELPGTFQGTRNRDAPDITISHALSDSPGSHNTPWPSSAAASSPSLVNDLSDEHRTERSSDQSAFSSLPSMFSSESSHTRKSPQRRFEPQTMPVSETSGDLSAIRASSSLHEQSGPMRLPASSEEQLDISNDIGESDMDIEMDVCEDDTALKPKRRLFRPMFHDMAKINTLPPIGEQDNVQTLLLSSQQASPLRPAYSQHQPPEIDRQHLESKEQRAQGTVARSLKRSLVTCAPRIPRQASTPKFKNTKSERLRAIKLSNSFLTLPTEFFSTAPIVSVGHADSRWGLPNEANDCSANVGGSIDDQRCIDTKSNNNQIGSRSGTGSSTDNVASDDNINTTLINTNNSRKRPTFTNSKRTAIPSPMIKSRSAIASQYVGSQTPKWLTRRMPKISMNNQRPPDLSSKNVRNATKSAQRHHALLTPTSSDFSGSSHHNLPLPALEGDRDSDAIEYGVEPDTDSPPLLMPPPPPPPTRPPKMPKRGQPKKPCRSRRPATATFPSLRSRSVTSQSIDIEMRDKMQVPSDLRPMPAASTLNHFRGSQFDGGRKSNGDSDGQYNMTGRELTSTNNESRSTSKSRPESYFKAIQGHTR